MTATQTWQEKIAAGPGLILLAGGLPLVSPTLKPAFDDPALMDEILIATAPDYPRDRARLLVVRAEAAMGTTDYHRIVALEARGLISTDEANSRRDAIRRRVSEDRRRALLERSMAGSRPRDPEFVEKIAAAQEAAAQAQAQADALKAVDPKKHRREIKRLERRASQFAADASKHWEDEKRREAMLGQVHDVVVRAKETGRDIEVEEVEAAQWVKDKYGAQVRHRTGQLRGKPVIKYETSPRLRLRDSLLSAMDSGYLDEGEHAFGLQCRDDYDARRSDGASQIGDAGGGGHDNDRFVYTRMLRAWRTNRIAVVERAVAVHCRDEPACLQMLREVVGARKALSVFGEGRAVERHGKALARALRTGKVAAIEWEKTRPQPPPFVRLTRKENSLIF